MFEAVIALCLGTADASCRDQLLPGYEAETKAACAEALRADPPNLDWILDLSQARCTQQGEVASVVEVAPGLYVHEGQIASPNHENRGDVSNMGFIIGEDAVIVIDTGTARWLGEALWRSIRERTDLPVTHVVLTHMHPDHVFGVSAFADAGALVVGHDGLSRALADRQANYLESLNRLIGPEIMLGSAPRPIDVTVEDEMILDLGGRSVLLRAWPAAHTRVDVTVTDLSEKVMFAGDLVFHRHAPALDGKLRGWQAVLKDMARLNITHVVPGHGGPLLSWPGGAEAQQNYLSVLAEDTKAAIDAGQRLGTAVHTIAQDEAENWELFEEFNPRNATVAFTELEWE